MANPIEFDTPIWNVFVGREQELEILQRELLGALPKTICITGPPGIGKTSLAMMFAELKRSAFPAGVYNLHATPFESVDKTIDHDVHRNSSPYLVILNDLEARPPEEVGHELTALRRKHPKARVLATSRFAHPLGVDHNLRLEGLSQGEFRELLEKRLSYVGSPQFAHDLYASLMGHPLATRLAASLLERGEVTPRELLELLQAFTWPGVVDSLGEEIPDKAPERRQIVADVVTVNDEFLRRFHEKPELLYELTPRGFEELVAELLTRLDYEVTLTPASTWEGWRKRHLCCRLSATGKIILERSST